MTSSPTTMTGANWAVLSQDLTKHFGEHTVVEDVNLMVPAGTIYGCLGPNGAGKTTVVRMLSGLLKPSRGRAYIDGSDVNSEPKVAKTKLAIVPDEPETLGKLTAREYLLLVGLNYGLDTSVRQSRTEELLEVFGLQEKAREYTDAYSHGQKQKCALAGALIASPRVLFLDEPTVALDAATAWLVTGILQDFAEGGGTVFITSHNMSAVESLCHRLAIMNEGHLVAEGTLASLQREAGMTAHSDLEEVFLALTGDSTDYRPPSFLRGRGEADRGEEDPEGQQEDGRDPGGEDRRNP